MEGLFKTTVRHSSRNEFSDERGVYQGFTILYIFYISCVNTTSAIRKFTFSIVSDNTSQS